MLTHYYYDYHLIKVSHYFTNLISHYQSYHLTFGPKVF